MKFAINKVLVFLLVLLFIGTLFNCKGHPDEEQIQALEETKAAALAAEKSLADKQKERNELEATLAAKKKELEEVKMEKENVLQKLEAKKAEN